MLAEPMVRFGKWSAERADLVFGLVRLVLTGGNYDCTAAASDSFFYIHHDDKSSRYIYEFLLVHPILSESSFQSRQSNAALSQGRYPYH